MVITRGKEVLEEVVKGQVQNDGRRFDFDWYAQNTIFRWYIIKLYTCNLYSFIGLAEKSIKFIP